MEIFAGSSLDWVSCIHVFMQVSLTSSAEFRNFIKLRLKIAFKSWNSYKTWHEITRLSAPTQISHILLKVWLGWSRLRALWWTLDTCSVDSRRPYPGVVDCGAHHAVQNLFLLGPATKLLFSRGRDTWHVTADTWHSVTIPPFCRQSQGESRPEWQQSSKMWQKTNNWWSSGSERQYYHNIRSWGAVVKVWGISNRMSKYFINKNNFSDMVLSSKTRTQNIN